MIDAKWGSWIPGERIKEHARPHGSSLWRKISMGRQNFRVCIRSKVGNRKGVRFWSDEGVEGGRLSCQFPQMHAIACSMLVKRTVKGLATGTGMSKLVEILIIGNC